jgi:hypothetical protein
MRQLMRVGLPILALLLAVGVSHYRRARPQPLPAAAPTTATKIDFATQVRPLLEARCTPCHFAGGKMYERLPFDRPETIKQLGTKLFTRIKDEKEQRLLSDFLAQQSDDNPARP